MTIVRISETDELISYFAEQHGVDMDSGVFGFRYYRDGVGDRYSKLQRRLGFKNAMAIANAPDDAAAKTVLANAFASASTAAVTNVAAGSGGVAKLTYWDGRGNAEIIRLMLEVCGEAYEAAGAARRAPRLHPLLMRSREDLLEEWISALLLLIFRLFHSPGVSRR